MAAPPPRNLLREASPNGRTQQRSWRQRYHGRRSGRFRIDQDDSDGDDDLIEGEWVDVCNPLPHARAYIPRNSRLNSRDNYKNNYPLEAASASGHLDVVREILLQHDFLGQDESDLKNSLIVASGNGHIIVVQELLERMDDDNIPLRESLVEAASHGHVPIVRILLAHERAAESQVDRLKATIRSAVASKQTQAFSDILEIVRSGLSAADLQQELLELLPQAAKDDRSDIIDIVLLHCSPINWKVLMRSLRDACRGGKLAAAKMLHAAMPLQALSTWRYSKFLRLAVENGFVNVVKFLLPPFRERGDSIYLRDMIIVSAGCGYTEILTLLLREVEGDGEDIELLQQALIVAAKNGHEDNCALLIDRGADPLMSTSQSRWADISVDEGREEWDLRFCDSDAEDEARSGKTKTSCIAQKKRVRFNENDDTQRNPLLNSESRKLNAVEACIAGFSHFQQRDDYYWLSIARRISWWKEGSQEGQSATLRLLLHDAMSLEDKKWDEAVCAAARWCPPSLLGMLLDKGANPFARHGTQSAMRFALQRQRLHFSALQVLVRNGVDDVPKDELAQMLKQASSFFEHHTGRPDSQGALFPEIKSLQDVFTVGPGAAVEYLLSLDSAQEVPHEQACTILQCAVVAEQTELVMLLLKRGADVNAPGGYYGTALQAACRFGKFLLVKVLLDAGADPNIVQGCHHTALRAAVRSANVDVVQLLLDAGADIELSSNWSYTDGSEDDPAPLQLALDHKHVAIAQVLVAAGANVNAQGKSRQPTLLVACQLGDIPLIEALLNAGAHIQTYGHKKPHWGNQQPEEISGLHAAIEKGYPHVIKFLVSRGFDMSADFPSDELSWKEHSDPLTFAAYKGNVDIIECLLQLLPDITAEDMLVALDKAIREKHFEATEKLLYHNPAVLDHDSYSSLLRIACYSDELRIVELILEELSYRGDVQSGCTAVLSKMPTGKADVFEMILEYVPCTADLFVEAAARGYEGVVKIGLAEGIPADTVDSQGRPALHFAAMQGCHDIVRLLLQAGADANADLPPYGAPLIAALEVYALNGLSEKELPEEVQKHAEAIILDRWRFKYHPGGPKTSLSYRQAQRYTEIVKALLTRGASPNPRWKHLGSALTLAAFTGVHSMFTILQQNGASMDDHGGYLLSPLLAAIEGSHMDLAKEMIEHVKAPKETVELQDTALHTACQTSTLPAVKMLLKHGFSPCVRNRKGETPLRIALSRLAKRIDRRFGSQDRSHEEVIVHLLLDADAANVNEQDLLTTAKGKDEASRTRVLERMIPRMETHFFPEDAYMALLEDRVTVNWSDKELSLPQRLLQERRIRCITSDMVAVVDAPRGLEVLLDYDQNYTVTTETLDVVSKHHVSQSREKYDILLRRNASLAPSEMHVVTVLKSRHHRIRFHGKEEQPKPHILELMFSRNPQICVTDEMLVAAQNVEDMKILLAHPTTTAESITPSVMSALGKNYSSEFEELIKLLLDFVPNVAIPEETANHIVYKGRGTAGLRMLWKHDPIYAISEQALLTLVNKFSAGNSGPFENGKENANEEILELLLQHKGQWVCTEKVKAALEFKFKEQSEYDIKKSILDVLDKGAAKETVTATVI